VSDKKSDPKQGKIPADIAKMNFEAALEELEDIVRSLEDGRGELDDAIKAYERGAWLKLHCEKRLQEARMRVEKIVVGSDDTVSAQSADFD
jgi:exodeoxyribonuclease VII small subunit